MITHPFAAAAARGDRAAMASLFAEDVTYHTPVLTADLHGKDLALGFLARGTRIVDGLEYTDEIGDDERTILFWRGVLDQRAIAGATVLAGQAGDLIRDITVLQRPWGVAANFRDAMLRALADVVPLPAWQLDDRKAPEPDPDAGAGQQPTGPLALAPDVAFHGAVLTKTVYGQQNVEAIHQLTDGIQGARTYLARFTSTGRLVEYWNCVIDGHPLQGIDDFTLDGNGRVTDQTVWLRPWPVVALLRDRALAAQPPFLPADYWRLPAGPSQLSLQPGQDEATYVSIGRTAHERLVHHRSLGWLRYRDHPSSAWSRQVGPMDLSRQEIIQMLRRAGLADVAAAAQKSLPDPVDSKVLDHFCAGYGLLRQSLIDRMGGSP